MHDEISDLALKFLQDFTLSPIGHAVFLREDITKDEAMLYKQYYESNLAWDNLLDLGLVEDGRPTRGQWLDNLEKQTQRVFRMFVLTEHGRLMSQPMESQWVN